MMPARLALSLVAAALAGCATTPMTTVAHSGPPAMRAWAASCKDSDEWDRPGPPFLIHGQTWYVGTCGISAILIVGPEGHTLIDSGTHAGADAIARNINALGFRLKEVRTLIASHEHFDHVGGMARMLETTGADLVFSEAGLGVLSSGKAGSDDPQFGMHDAMRPVDRGMPHDWGNAPYLVDRFGISPVETPGHTPGAMSWHWQSCEGDSCVTITYADSLTPVSSDSYRFSDHPAYVADFRESLAKIAALDCDIALTPHPSSTRLRDRLLGTAPLISREGCKGYAAEIAARLDQRLAEEARP